MRVQPQSTVAGQPITLLLITVFFVCNKGVSRNKQVINIVPCNEKLSKVNDCLNVVDIDPKKPYNNTRAM